MNYGLTTNAASGSGLSVMQYQPDKAISSAKTSPVDQHVSAVNSEIESLHQAMDELMRRLTPVMKPPLPAVNTPAQQTNPPLTSPLGEAIRAHHIRLCSLHGRIAMVLDNLEV